MLAAKRHPPPPHTLPQPNTTGLQAAWLVVAYMYIHEIANMIIIHGLPAAAVRMENVLLAGPVPSLLVACMAMV